MATQARRWTRAAGAVGAAALVMNAVSLFEVWQVVSMPGNSITITGVFDSGLLRRQLAQLVGETLVILLLLALARLVSRRLLHGRFAIAVGAVLLVAAALTDDWFTFHGGMEGVTAIVYGTNGLLAQAALPMAAGAWTLRSRTPELVPVADTTPFEGVWEGPAGVLSLEPEGLFTLHRGGGEAVEGSWEPETGLPPQLLLRVDAPTALGHGWQTTVLDIEHRPDGAEVLRLADGIAFARRPAELVVEQAGGYQGGLELLES
ncbi:hypothetical protein GXW83_31020 [Streptacidiphilus sp. PB12-B1b]|uniref:hypothetical protein n=1 Tax=Streptacidiphilus sp. PB12-B1b TaxID=2705012 RepID=UPI0015F8A728|nr:hypothetical protein [Streptacidiphilus sp. PB12-B1b]QMU79479.1 hypothetical protein GXW83_31020 [Streptacidiphilus sp. PB12-B1b]